MYSNNDLGTWDSATAGRLTGLTSINNIISNDSSSGWYTINNNNIIINSVGYFYVTIQCAPVDSALNNNMVLQIQKNGAF